MNRLLFLLLAWLVVPFATLADSNWGTIIFQNRNIRTASGTGGSNGNGTYNVPIWDDSFILQGAGKHAGGFTVGLFLPGAPRGTRPLATSKLRTDSFSAFFATAAQTVSIPGFYPGETPILEVRGWVGDDEEDAYWLGQRSLVSWFRTQPLGGEPLSGGLPIVPPGMTGWGIENGVGLNLSPLSLFPFTGIRYPKNGSVFAAPATIEIVGSAIPNGDVYNTVRLYANSELLSSEFLVPGIFTVQTRPLPAGTYTLKSTLSQGDPSPGDLNSAPVTITVVDPVPVSLGSQAVVNGQFSFTYSANPGLRYLVQTSVDLQTWQPLATNAPTSTPVSFSEPFEPSAAKFYRVDLLPNQ